MFNVILKDILKITILSHKIPHLLPFMLLSKSHLVIFQGCLIENKLSPSIPTSLFIFFFPNILNE